MFITSKSTLFIALAFATLTASGCGASITSPTSLGAKLQASTSAGAPANPGRGGPLGHDDHGNPNDPQALLASLTLTDDQKTQLAALVAKYKPVAPTSKPSDDANSALQAILLVTTVDDTALRAALAARQTEQAAHQPSGQNDQLVAIRALLTDDQRAQIVAQLQAGPTGGPSGTPPSGAPKGMPGGAPLARPSGAPPSGAPQDPGAAAEAKLNLSTAQAADLAAFKAALQPAASSASAKPTDRNAALIAFWQTGDVTGFVAPTPPTFPVEAFVTLAEALDLTQRQALFAHGLMLADGGHGGPGGPGGDHGPGGPGGDHDGPGGDRGPAPSASPAAAS